MSSTSNNKRSSQVLPPPPPSQRMKRRRIANDINIDELCSFTAEEKETEGKFIYAPIRTDISSVAFALD